jgi:hypothetical protein
VVSGYTYTQGSPVEIQTPTQRDHPAVCVIAQQYSSSTFVSLRFHSRKEMFGALFQNRYLVFSFKLRKSQIA